MSARRVEKSEAETACFGWPPAERNRIVELTGVREAAGLGQLAGLPEHCRPDLPCNEMNVAGDAHFVQVQIWSLRF